LSLNERKSTVDCIEVWYESAFKVGSKVVPFKQELKPLAIRSDSTGVPYDVNESGQA
jgi:hypothetical protein